MGHACQRYTLSQVALSAQCAWCPVRSAQGSAVGSAGIAVAVPSFRNLQCRWCRSCWLLGNCNSWRVIWKYRLVWLSLGQAWEPVAGHFVVTQPGTSICFHLACWLGQTVPTNLPVEACVVLSRAAWEVRWVKCTLAVSQ